MSEESLERLPKYKGRQLVGGLSFQDKELSRVSRFPDPPPYIQDLAKEYRKRLSLHRALTIYKEMHEVLIPKVCKIDF